MSITLSYLSDLSRVRIELASLPDGTVQIQRAANGSATDAMWERGVVRGGVALPIESGAGQLDDYEFFADVATHYRAVPVDPPAGLLLPGASGDYASTPDAAALDITGDLSLRGLIRPADWESANQTVVAKWTTTGDQRSYMLWVDSSGFLNLSWSTDGTAGNVATATSTVKPTPDADGQLAVRADLDVDNGSSQHEVTFSTATTLAGDWTQLGDVVSDSGITSVNAGTAVLEVGANDVGTADRWDGSIMAVEVYDGIGGSETLVADPDFSAQTAAAASFDDGQGLTWTMQGNAEIVGIWQDSTTASLDGEVWIKSIQYPAVNRTVKLLDRNDPLGRESRSTVQPVVGRSAGTATHDRRLGRRFDLHILTEGPDHADDAGEWDIIFGAGSDFFIHVPADSAVPGGYVAIDGEQVTTRLYRGDNAARRIITIPCQVETPPAPGVTGTLLTGDTVLRLYGSGQALISAHATGRSLLQTMLDPDDLVTL